MTEELPPSGKAINKWLIDSGIVKLLDTTMDAMRAFTAAERRRKALEFQEEQREYLRKHRRKKP